MLRYLILFVSIFLIDQPQAYAHGGGLNAEGCHNDRKRGGYHCHRGSPAPLRRPQTVYTAPKPNTPSSALTPPIEGTGKVLDGDTIQIGTTRIRFYGIDAFEGEQRCTSASGQSYGCGGIATRALAEHVEGKLVSCVPKGIDAYKRQLAVCRAEAIDLSSWMARQGHALAYIKYSLDYEADEAFAKEKVNGAHAGSFEKPWEYRLTRGAAGAEAIRQNTPPSLNCTIKGNVRSDGTRIYHMPSDPSYSRVKPENWFCDVDEAKRAGFRPAYKTN